MKHRNLTKFIHFSSILIYDEKRITLPVSEHAPINPYKNRYVLSKYLAEEACKFFARWVPIINCRFCNLYGPTPLERYDLNQLLARKLLQEGKPRSGAPPPSGFSSTWTTRRMLSFGFSAAITPARSTSEPEP